MKTDAQCSQLPAKGRFFFDLCFRPYKLRRFRKYCQKTVIKSSPPKCQIPSRFRATTIGAETKVKKRDKSLLSSSTSGTTDMDNTVIKGKKKKKKKELPQSNPHVHLLSVSPAQISFPCSPSCSSFNHYLQTRTIPAL